MRMVKPYYQAIVVTTIFVFPPPLVMAETVNLHCKGVDYIYESGLGKGTSKREAANRSIILDVEEMTVTLVNGLEERTTQLTKKYGDYQGFFPGEKQIFGSTVLGEEVEVNSAFDLLELRYLLEDEKKYLSFTGICKR